MRKASSNFTPGKPSPGLVWAGLNLMRMLEEREYFGVGAGQPSRHGTATQRTAEPRPQERKKDKAVPSGDLGSDLWLRCDLWIGKKDIPLL